MAEMILPLSGGSDSFYEETLKQCMDKRIIILNQDIDDAVVEDVVMHIILWNIQDCDIPKNKRKPITIILNSVGGDVFSGMNVVDVIQQSVTPIKCIAMGLVASAAYYIYITAHKRYAFENSVFLQHDGSLSVSNSNSKAKQTMAFFDEMEKRIKQHILSHSVMSEEFYDSKYDQEFYFYSDKAKELGVVDEIIGNSIDFTKVLCE